MLTGQPQREYRLVHKLVTAFVLLTCLRVWIGPVCFVEPAGAQMADPVSQRRQVLEETRRTNQLLTDIAKNMKTHTFKVSIEGADKELGRHYAPPREGADTVPNS